MIEVHFWLIVDYALKRRGQSLPGTNTSVTGKAHVKRGSCIENFLPFLGESVSRNKNFNKLNIICNEKLHTGMF